MAAEVRDFAVKRAGGIAWEYQFQFGGGRPPWVSGLAQGTGIQALSRAAARLHEPEWFDVARARRWGSSARRRPRECGSGPGTARTTWPTRTPRASGSSTRSSSRSSACTTSPHSPTIRTGRRLWLDGERQAAREVHQADTGSWSLYQPGVPSDIGYHKVLRDFVRGLCDRMEHDRQVAVQRLRATQGPGAVLEQLDRWPDPAPFCIATQTLNRQLYSRLQAMGLPTPWG